MKRILFVDDDPQLLAELRQALADRSRTWEMAFVNSGAEALSLMARHPFDVVVTDMTMPRMDGFALLTKVRQRHPQTVRVILSGYSDWQTGLRLMDLAHHYLAKPADPAQIEGILVRSLNLRDHLASESLRKLVGRLESLPSIPALYFELLEQLRPGDASAQRIGQIIERDMGMCAKMLRLVNSALFALPRPVTNPVEAVTYLGVETVRSLVLSLQIFSLFEKVRIAGFSYEQLWSHSWATAAVAKRLGELEQQTPEEVDYAFVAGLLHDVGKLVLAANLPERFQKAIALQNQPMPSWSAEHQVFAATHAEVGAYLLGLWGLADPIVEAVALHHRPVLNSCRTFSPTTAVHAANYLVHEQQSPSGSPMRSTIDLPYLTDLGLHSRWPLWVQEIQGLPWGQIPSP